MDNSRAEAGNIQDKPGTSSCAIKQGNAQKQTNNDGGMSEDHRSQWKELPMVKSGTI